MIENYDLEIEKRHHPENFEPVDECDICQFEKCDECGFSRRQRCGECGEAGKIVAQCEKCGCAVCEKCHDHQNKC